MIQRNLKLGARKDKANEGQRLPQTEQRDLSHNRVMLSTNSPPNKETQKR